MNIKDLFIKNNKGNTNDFWEPLKPKINFNLHTSEPVTTLVNYFRKNDNISFYQEDELKKKLVFLYKSIIPNVDLVALLENNNNETSIAYIKNLYSKYKTNDLQYEDIIGYIGINRVEAKDVAISLLEEFEKNHETIICCPSFFLAKETLTENWNDKLILSNIVDYDYVTKLITTDGIIEYKINNYINAYRLLTSDKSPEMNYEEIVKHLVAHDYSGKFCLQRLLNPIKSCLPDLVQNQVFKDTQRTFDYGTKRKLLPSYDPNKQDKIDKAFYHSNLKNKIDKSLIQTLDQMLRIVIGEAEKMKVTEEVFKSQASKDWLAYSKNEKTAIDPQKFVGCFYDFARLDLFNDFKALFACIESKHPTLLENPHYVHFRTLYSVNFLKPEFIKIFMSKETFRKVVYTGKDRELRVERNIGKVYKILTGKDISSAQLIEDYKKRIRGGTSSERFTFIELCCPAYALTNEYKDAKLEIMDS